jgi:protoporphyrinogen/coproporphyrinogen III oxidase
LAGSDPFGHNVTSRPPRIAIIGGGISGLAAAHRITELLPHAELSLFETSDRLGGILDTVHRNGFLVERSADSFQTKVPYAVDLCRRLGIADQLLPTDDARRRAMVVHNGRLIPVPAGFYLMSPIRLRPVLRSPILSLPGKLRLLAEPLVPRSGSTADGADESVASFATRRLGRETFERLVQPLVAGIYTGDAARLSMAATLPEFLDYERNQSSLLRATLGKRSAAEDAASGARYGLFAAPKDGIASLISALANTLPTGTVNLNTNVTSVSRTSEGQWHLRPLPSGEGRGEVAVFNATILATPTHSAAKILTSAAPDLAAALSEIEYASCSVVTVACRRSQISHPLDSFGFVVPQIENRRIIAASFASQKFPGRAPTDGVLIRVFVGGALAPQLADLPDADLKALVLCELVDLLDLRGEPIWIDIARWPRSMPQYHVGHLARIARIEQLTARLPTLALAGNAYHGVGIPQCIHSGEQAAERIARQLSS